MKCPNSSDFQIRPWSFQIVFHMPNLLAHESVALLQHQNNNPIELLSGIPGARGRIVPPPKQQRPIFLSIGYSACHWCYVMEHESFENDAIAASQ